MSSPCGRKKDPLQKSSRILNRVLQTCKLTCGVMCVGSVLHLYRCRPLYTSRRFSLQSMHIVRRVMFLLVRLSVSSSTLFVACSSSASIPNLSHQSIFYQALLYMMRVYFLPCGESWHRALNLSVFDRDHTIDLIELFLLLVRSRPGRSEGLFYFFVSFYAAHCSDHCPYFLLYIYWVWCRYKDIIMRHICVYFVNM